MSAGGDANRVLFTAEQIEVPPLFPAMLKAYVKEVIRFNPKNIETFSRDYWTHVCNKDVDKFLEGEAAKKKSEQQANDSKKDG